MSHRQLLRHLTSAVSLPLEHTCRYWKLSCKGRRYWVAWSDLTEPVRSRHSLHACECIGLLLYVSYWSKVVMRLSDCDRDKTTVADSGRDVVIGGVFGR